MKQFNLSKHPLFKFKPNIVLLALLLCFSFNKTNSQETLVAYGGNMASADGSASYSIGQTIQDIAMGANGSAIQGIQFYFEDSTLQIVDMETNLSIATYPNPTSAFVNIKIDNLKNEKLSYELYDILGKVLIKRHITSNLTKINIEDLPNAVYLLKLNNSNNKHVKTLKIIKN